MGNKNTQCAELFSGKPDAPDDTPEPVKDAEVIASPSKQAMKPATTNSDEPAAAAQQHEQPRKPSTPGSLKRMEKREQRRAVTASLPENWRLLEERQRAIIRRLAECERAAGYVGTNRVKKQEWYDAARLPGLGGKNYLKGGKRGKHWIKGIEGGGRYGKDAASSSGGGGADEEDDGGAMVERGNEAASSGEVSGQTSWYAGKSDEDIVRDTVSWLAEEMRSMMIYREYPEIYERAVTILEKWRRSFPKGVWIRVVKSGRIAKELNECAPVIQHAMDRVAKMPTPTDPDERATIIDLCSGFGYLGMFLAEMLDPAKVKLIALVDKQWPMFNAGTPKSHQINWDHVYGVDGWDPAWPIKLQTRKDDIKQAGQLRQIEKHVFGKHKGPFVILAVHLCGTLSVKAVEMFNLHANASDLVLKPCCLPGWNHTYTHDTWELGGHCIPVKDVCAKGKWKGNRWIGPPRAHLRHKFALWCENLYKGIDVDDAEKRTEQILIQEEGGHQNTFMFVERQKYDTKPGTPMGIYAPKADE